jgi:BirA family biotin operon repressor/biotin-[acetyl-CoA-carboxylase] ligase
METVAPLWQRFHPGHVIGRRVLGYGDVPSTMNLAWDLSDHGAVNGTAVVAETQSQGRGRFGRRWTAAPGDALLVSIILRGEVSPIGPLLPIQTSLAVHSTVHDLSGLDCSIKWPNDLLLAGRKLCGILVEVRADTAGNRNAVVGVGLNLNLDPDGHDDIRETATSIRRETGISLTSAQAAESLFAHLTEEIACPADDTLHRWKQRLDTLGKHVTVYQRDGSVTGVAEDVSPVGTLLLKSDDGTLKEITEGDVSLTGPFP